MKASDYTHSPWSGKKYRRAQTDASLAAESLKVLKRHPTIGKCLSRTPAETAAMMAKLFGEQK